MFVWFETEVPASCCKQDSQSSFLLYTCNILHPLMLCVCINQTKYTICLVAIEGKSTKTQNYLYLLARGGSSPAISAITW